MSSHEEVYRILTPKRSSRAKKPYRSHAASLPPRYAEELNQLVDAFCVSDEQYRQGNVQACLRTCVPQVVGLVCSELVNRLAHTFQARRAQVKASLVQIGSPALPAVTNRMLHARGEEEQLALIDILVKIGLRLPGPDRIDIFDELFSASMVAATDNVRRELAAAIATMRRQTNVRS